MDALHLVLTIAVFVTFCHCQDTGLTVFGPRKIYPKRDYTIALTNMLRQRVRLQATLENLDNPSMLKQIKTREVDRQSSKSITFKVGDIESCDCYQLEVKSLDPNFSFYVSEGLVYGAKTALTLIEIDKPVYNPGDKLRFRVIVVDTQTKPLASNETIQIEIKDPANTVFRKWPFARLHKGVFESSVQLTSSLDFGKWSLTVIVDGVEKHKFFEVKEYVLPKFFVKAYPLGTVLLEDMAISIRLEAAYTFGHPVEGRYKAELFLDDPNPDHVAKGNINGNTTLHFRLKEQVHIPGSSDVTQVTLKVEVQATLSNHIVNVTERIPIFRNSHNMTMSLKRSLRPGLPNTVSIRVKDHHGRPPGENKPKHASITAYFDSFEREYRVVLNNYGEGKVKLDVPDDAEAVRITGKYNQEIYEMLHLEDIRVERSESNTYISVIMDPRFKEIRINEDVQFIVTSTVKMSYIAYIVVTRGNIIKCSYEAFRTRTSYTLKLRMTPEMSPESRLLVYTIKNGFLLNDDVELKFDKFNNNFAVKLDKESYFPGETISLEVHAARDSYFALNSVDQSLLLVEKNRHNFDRNDLLQELAEFSNMDFENSLSLIHTFGLFVISTARVDSAVSPRGSMYRFGSSILNDRSRINSQHIRTQFMASFLWENSTMNGRDSDKTIEVIAPDSTTTYLLSGFALSPTMGLGMMKQPLRFTIRQDFYLDVSLPYSVKRGEVLVVRAIIFNFYQHKLTTQVTLYSKIDQLEFVERSSNNSSYRSKAVIALPNTGTSVSFMVKAKQIGLVAIKLRAECQLATDAIEHMLRVKPESHQYHRCINKYIELPTHETINHTFVLDVPKKIDAGSLKIYFFVDPHILGAAIKNLGDLIRLPSGCGEQNMVHLVPNIVILDYLSESKTVAETVKSKAIDYLNKGLQNQLKYRRQDGSFSVWEDSEKGSTFLTAFVAKSLKIAAKYTEVDKAIVNKAFDWLVKKQLPDGQFPEVGTIFHQEIQGGISSTSSRFALTAYVLIALAENQEVREKYNVNVNLTADYLRNNFDSINDEYDLALVTYGFFLINDGQKKNFLDKLIETSIYNGTTNELYWSKNPVQIEIAGYALLTYVLNNMAADATPIMRWLSSQRYDRGAFAGTQDTFVGLKALAAFAARVSPERNNYQVTVYQKNKDLKKTEVLIKWDVNPTENFDIKTGEITKNIRELHVEINGIGYGVMQVAYEYYESIMTRTKYAFKLDLLVMSTTTNDVLHLKVCVAYDNREAYRKSNMALVEIFVPSGFIFEKDAMEDITGQIKKVERRFGDSSLVVYYDYLTPMQSCFKVTAKRLFRIALHLPSYVKVYDYYDPDQFAIKQYEGKVMQLCDICEDMDCNRLSC